MRKLAEIRAERMVSRALEGRPRRRDAPEQGRFARADARCVSRRAAERFEEILRGASLPKGLGARRNVRAGIWSLALFRALKDDLGDADYATELATDVLWVGYERPGRPFRALARLLFRDPRKRLHLFVRLGLIFPFGRPGYEWSARAEGRTLATDFRRCPVWDFFRTQDEEARSFFRRSWCTLDYPLAEALVEGGRYERPHTLSEGDAVCDMRWIAPGEG